MKYFSCFDSPIGNVYIAEDGIGISNLCFEKKNLFRVEEDILEKETELIKEAKKQLKEYFANKRQIFTLPLSLKGTEFQNKNWKALCEIPYGETKTYKEIAEFVSLPKGSRAVGNANGKNPICIIIPCHRVIKSDGTIGGYSAGLDKKIFLMNLEGIELYKKRTCK